MHFFVVLLAYKNVDWSTFCMKRASASNKKYNIVEFFFVNLICVRLIAVGNWLFTSDVVMETRESSGLSFIGM